MNLTDITFLPSVFLTDTFFQPGMSELHLQEIFPQPGPLAGWQMPCPLPGGTARGCSMRRVWGTSTEPAALSVGWAASKQKQLLMVKIPSLCHCHRTFPPLALRPSPASLGCQNPVKSKSCVWRMLLGFKFCPPAIPLQQMLLCWDVPWRVMAMAQSWQLHKLSLWHTAPVQNHIFQSRAPGGSSEIGRARTEHHRVWHVALLFIFYSVFVSNSTSVCSGWKSAGSPSETWSWHFPGSESRTHKPPAHNLLHFYGIISAFNATRSTEKWVVHLLSFRIIIWGTHWKT